MSQEAISNCRYCLMCRHVAPVGHITSNETLTPHGIALMVASQRRGLLKWNTSTLRVLYAEPDAGLCRAHCVTDQRLPAAIAAVRAEIAARGLAPDTVVRLHHRLLRTGSAFGERVHQTHTHTSELALFAGDEAHNLWPESITAARLLLEACSTSAALVGAGASNGYLACSIGFPATARKNFRACVEEARDASVTQLLVLSPADLFTFRQMGPERLGVIWPADIVLTDFATFLARRIQDGTLQLRAGAGDAAYVDPTHAVRASERFNPIRSLATTVLGQAPRELFWRRERAHPVGSTAVQFTRPDIAEALTRARLEDAKATGAGSVLCEDPATLVQLTRFAPDYGLKVQGLFEALAALIRP